MGELEELAEKGRVAREIVLHYVSLQKGHDNCHWYPEIFEELMDLFGINYELNRKLPPREDFRKRCLIYERKLYGV